MNPVKLEIGSRFWGRWLIATMIAWVVGLFGAIVLSYTVVNPL
jgi:hypothetical protein